MANWARAQDTHAVDRIALGERPQAALGESTQHEIPVGNLPKEARATLAIDEAAVRDGLRIEGPDLQ